MSKDYRNCIESALNTLPKKSLFIDVGCNINPIVDPNYDEYVEDWNDDFTSIFLEYLPDSSGIGIEPIHWQSYEKKWKDDSRVQLMKIAMSDEEKYELMFSPKQKHVLSSFYLQDDFIDDDLGVIEVPCKTIDGLGLKYIDYLKIDTEGSEYKILNGCENSLKNKKISFIQFEYGLIDENIPSLEIIAKLLNKFNYHEVITSNRESLWTYL
jgi:FkbM family methyltransferase